MKEGFHSLRVEEDYTWRDDIMTVTRRIIDEIDDARLSNIAAHFEVDVSEIREFLEAKHRKHLTPTTHADKLRAMSDEELAEFMCHNVSNGTVNCAFCAAAEFCRMGHNGWLDWLRQEAKE